MHDVASNFTGSLRLLRRSRKLSQLDLALAANVSQRHVSWLETGRSQPSRDMVLRLAEAMDIPLRQRNELLNAAGFAHLYSENALDEPAMNTVRSVLDTMLEHHEPYPTLVLDAQWNILMQNHAATRLFSVFGDPSGLWAKIGHPDERNLALASVHPQGLRQFIKNWDDIAPEFLRRLRNEATESGDPKVISRYESLSAYFDAPLEATAGALIPMLPIELEIGDLCLSMCSVISTFGTAQDITANELRVETFYPANAETARCFAAQQGET